MSPAEPPRQRAGRRPLWPVAWTAGAVVVGLLLALLTPEPHIEHRSALGAVFDSRWMVAGARLLALVFLVYAVVSVGVRMGRGQWVRSVGPVDTDAQVLRDSQTDLEEQVRAADATIEDLRRRLRESDRRYLDLVGRLREPDDAEGGQPR